MLTRDVKLFDMAHKVIKNTLSQGIGKAVVVFLSLLTTALLTRYLGARGYGAYTFITAFTLLLGQVADWGTNIIAVREASQKKKAQGAIFGSILLFRLFLASVAFLLLNVVIRLRPDWQGFVSASTVASFVLLALSLKTSLNVVFQTLLRYDKAAIVEIASSTVFLVLVAATFIMGQGLTMVMLSWFIATLLASALGLFFATRLSPFVWSINLTVVKRVFWEALPAGGLFLVFTLYNRIDTIILQHFQGEVAVGIYGLSYKVHDNLVLGAAFLMNSMFPILSENFRAGAAAVKAHYQKAFDLLFVGGLFVSGAAFLFAPPLIAVLGGAQFADSVGVLRILSFATFIAYFNHLTGYSLIAFGKQRMSLLIATVALTFNLAANWVFIPLYSFKAAAVITIATEGLVLLLSSIVLVRFFGLRPGLFSFPKTWSRLIKTRGEEF